MSENSEKINQFKAITNASDQESTFYLESHNYDLEGATVAYFENQTSGGGGIPKPSQPKPAAATSHKQPSSRQSLMDMIDDEEEDDRPYRRTPLPQSTSSSSSSSSSSSKPKAKSAPSRGGIRTLSDFNSGDDDEGDDEDDKSQNYFTGGEKSGLMVQSAPKQKKNNNNNNDDVVDDVFDSAKKQGAKQHTEGSKPAPEYFDGTAYQLGSGGSAPSVVKKTEKPANAKEEEEVRITFWANGFTLNDGPLRRLDDPANREFIEYIQQGRVPPELEKKTPQSGLSIHLIDSRQKEYVEPPKPKYVAFSGGGQALGNTSNTSTTTTTSSSSSSTSSSSSAPFSRPTPTINVDRSQPTTTIMIRMADGTRQQVTFNESHTLENLVNFINGVSNSTRSFDLLTGFPQKPIVINPKQTLKEAGLLNETFIQKYK